jgi:hypothetical protein
MRRIRSFIFDALGFETFQKSVAHGVTGLSEA